MITITRSGNVFSGEGGVGVYVNGRQLVPAPAGGTTEYDDEAVLYQDIQIVDGREVATLRAKHIITGEEFHVADGGANKIRGEQRAWAAWIERATGLAPKGVRTSWGLHLPEAYLLALQQGCLYVRDGYQSGIGLSCYEVGSHTPRWTVPTARPQELWALSKDVVVWTERDWHIHARGLPLPDQNLECFTPFVVSEQYGYLWLGGHGEFGYLQPWVDGRTGYAIEPPTYGLTGRRSSDCVNGAVKIAWATDAGETRIRWEYLTPGQTQTTRLLIDPDFDFPKMTRGLSIAPFKDLDGSSPADSEILVNNQIQATKRPCWAALDSLPGVTGPLLGLYWEAGASDPTRGLAENLRAAQGLQTRVLACYDAADTYPEAILRQLRAWDVPALEVYCGPREPLIDFTQRVTRNVKNLIARWPHDIGLIGMWYCMGGAPPDEELSVQQVLDAEGLLPALLAMSSRIKMVAPFEYTRANGIIAHRPLQESFGALVRSSPGPATFEPVNPQPPPVVGFRSLLLLLESDTMTEGPIAVINSSQINKTDDPKKFTTTVGNPLNQTYRNVGQKGEVIPDSYIGADGILSINAAGDVRVRKPQSPGQDEKCSIAAGMLVYENVFEGKPVSFMVPFDGMR